MKKKQKTTYSQYLQLDKILDAHAPLSDKLEEPIHDETLFIIIHQIYELWFKQIIHEIDSIIKHFSQETITEANINTVVTRLDRINNIQKISNQQISVLMTMTPMDFLEFRDLLNPASGFQSAQFRIIENALGLKIDRRLKFSKKDYKEFLSKPEKDLVERYENKKSIFDLVENWLERTPFLESEEFNFWNSYKKVIGEMLDNDVKIIEDSSNLDEDEKNEQINNYKKIYGNYKSSFSIYL